MGYGTMPQLRPIEWRRIARRVILTLICAFVLAAWWIGEIFQCGI
jgi:hypothetical protein